MLAQSLASAGGDVAVFERQFAAELRLWLLAAPPALGWATLRSCVRLCLCLRPSGVWSAGNGPAMRSALLGVCFADDEPKLRAFVRVSTRITHTDPRAEFAALAVALAARLAYRAKTDAASFRASVVAGVDNAECCALLLKVVESAERGEDTRRFARAIGAGDGVSGYCYQTVPVALHAWLTSPGDIKAAVSAAISCGGDTDTVAAITGALVGSGVGALGLPAQVRIVDWPVNPRTLRALAPLVNNALQGRATSAPMRWHLVPAGLLRNLAFAWLAIASLSLRFVTMLFSKWS